MGLGKAVIFEKGKVYGSWTLIDDIRGTKNKNRLWLVRCRCGKERKIAPSPLVNGKILSCSKCAAKRRAQNQKGVDRSYMRVNGMQQNVASAYRNYVTRSLEKGMDIDITVDEFYVLSQQNCFYCGAEPSNKITHRKSEWVDPFYYNGLDRIDNSLGYIKGNVVPCCSYCNWAKKDKTQKDFFDWIERVYENIRSTKASPK